MSGGDRVQRSSSSGNNVSCFLEKSSPFNKSFYAPMPENPSRDYTRNNDGHNNFDRSKYLVNYLRFLGEFPLCEPIRTD